MSKLSHSNPNLDNTICQFPLTPQAVARLDFRSMPAEDRRDMLVRVLANLKYLGAWGKL